MIAWLLRNEIELPNDPPSLGVKRIHAPLHALEIATGIADENQSVPGNRCRRYALTLLRVSDRGLPQAITGLEVVREHAAILCPAEDPAVEIGDAAVDGLRRCRRVALTLAPILAAIGRVDREGVELCREQQCAVYGKDPRVEAGINTGIIGAEHPEPTRVLPVDLVQSREAIGSERLVVARPVAGILGR